jgi:opacity protein-like surface antigen
MRSVKSLVAAGAASLLSSMAFAADMAIAPPPMYAPAPVEDFGGWYLRGDIGMSNQSLQKLDNVDITNFNSQTVGLGFDSAPIFDLGVGYRLNNWFRADLTTQYRGRANFHGSDHLVAPGIIVANTYLGSKSEFVGLVNAYVDLGTWWCVTPFVGAGVGMSYNQIHGFQDNGSIYNAGILNNSVTYAADAGKWNLAWAVHAGLAYKVTPGFTVELGYSYLDLGSATTGANTGFDPSFPPNQNTWTMKNITSHDLTLGVRWELNSPQVYAPPLVRKG